jgi:imidazolonepropionase-like amidohydrolase
MRLRLTVIVVVAVAAVVGLGARQAATSSLLVVKDVTLIDGTGTAPRGSADIAVRDGRIESAMVHPGTVIDYIPGTTLIDGRGLYAIPGLIDAHVHLSGGSRDRTIAQLKTTVQGGVTSVFDLAGDARTTGDLAKASAAHEFDGPTIYMTALMAGPAFFTDPRVLQASRGFDPGKAPWAQAITPETDIAQAVAAAKATGAIAIKMYAALDATLTKKIADEAHKQGLRLVAHATVFPAKPGDLVADGVDILAHAPYLAWEGSPATSDYTQRARGDFVHVAPDSPAIDAVLDGMRAKDLALNPTLWIFAEGLAKDDLTDARIAWSNAVTRRANAKGVRIVAGTDDMLDPAKNPLPLLHRELEQLVSGAGLTPLQAITAATSGAAHAMGIEATRGTIAVGKMADLVLLSADPSADIRNTRQIRMVIKDGRLVYDSRTRRP